MKSIPGMQLATQESELLLAVSNIVMMHVKMMKIWRFRDDVRKRLCGDAKVKRPREADGIGSGTMVLISTRGRVALSSKYTCVRMRVYVYTARRTSRTTVKISKLLM
jgi:hypothetical protein